IIRSTISLVALPNRKSDRFFWKLSGNRPDPSNPPQKPTHPDDSTLASCRPDSNQTQPLDTFPGRMNRLSKTSPATWSQCAFARLGDDDVARKHASGRRDLAHFRR